MLEEPDGWSMSNTKNIKRMKKQNQSQNSNTASKMSKSSSQSSSSNETQSSMSKNKNKSLMSGLSDIKHVNLDQSSQFMKKDYGTFGQQTRQNVESPKSTEASS